MIEDRLDISEDDFLNNELHHIIKPLLENLKRTSMSKAWNFNLVIVGRLLFTFQQRRENLWSFETFTFWEKAY